MIIINCILLINIKSGETFNVGSDKGMQIKDIADIVAEKMPNSRGINLNTALIKPEETTSLVPNITSAKEKFNLDTSQLNFNRFLNIRLEEIYKKDFIENEFFKNDIWKKNEFMRIIKRFKACEGSFNTSYLKKNFQ